MKRPLAASLLAISALISGPAQVSAQPTVRVERSGEVAPGGSSESFAAGQAAEARGDFTSAIRNYRRLLKSDPLAPEAAEAQFRVAELYARQGSESRAFDEFQSLINRYPDSEYFTIAVAAQLEIANSFLQREVPTFFGLSLGPTPERIQEMYQTVISNAVYGEQAPIAQFNLGLAYEKANEWDLAVDSYQRVLDNYPNSGVADDALYQIGYVYYRLGATGRSRDLSALEVARETFQDFLIEFPNSEKASQARENLKQLTVSEAGDVLEIARFYDRSKDFKAAVIYYNDVIRRLPDSEDAKLAQTRIEELRTQYGEDALRPGPERTETGDRATIRRRLQAEVETSALSDYAGPPRREIVPDELPQPSRPRLRTNIEDIQPLPPVEPPLPTE